MSLTNHMTSSAVSRWPSPLKSRHVEVVRARPVVVVLGHRRRGGAVAAETLVEQLDVLEHVVRELDRELLALLERHAHAVDRARADVRVVHRARGRRRAPGRSPSRRRRRRRRRRPPAFAAERAPDPLASRRRSVGAASLPARRGRPRPSTARPPRHRGGRLGDARGRVYVELSSLFDMDLGCAQFCGQRTSPHSVEKPAMPGTSTPCEKFFCTAYA